MDNFLSWVAIQPQGCVTKLSIASDIRKIEINQALIKQIRINIAIAYENIRILVDEIAELQKPKVEMNI